LKQIVKFEPFVPAVFYKGGGGKGGGGGGGGGGGAREEFENVAHKNNPVFRNYPNKLFHIYIYIYI